MRLIDANELIATIEKKKGQFPTDGNEPFMAWEVIDYINDCDTINPEDCRPHGRWRYTATGGVVSLNGYCCSVCYEQFFRKPYNYCPNCGAKMDGKEQDDD